MNNEREIAEKMIADAERMAKEGRDKLAALDKPELRHGDYGINSLGCGSIVIGNGIGAVDHREDGISYNLGKSQNGKYLRVGDSCLGNIFDDLKRNSEDLMEYYVHHPARFLIRLEKDKINFLMYSTEVDISIKQATELHQKLGQLIATAKRKANANT